MKNFTIVTKLFSQNVAIFFLHSEVAYTKWHEKRREKFYRDNRWSFLFPEKRRTIYFDGDHAAQVSRRDISPVETDTAGCGETSTYRIPPPPPDSARHLGGAARRRLRRRRGVSARRESRYAARRWVIHRAYPARITPRFSFRSNPRGIDPKGNARTQKVQISEKMLRVTSENVLIALKRRVKRSSSLKDLYFHPLCLTQSVALLSPSLDRKYSQITIVIF